MISRLVPMKGSSTASDVYSRPLPSHAGQTASSRVVLGTAAATPPPRKGFWRVRRPGHRRLHRRRRDGSVPSVGSVDGHGRPNDPLNALNPLNGPSVLVGVFGGSSALAGRSL